jgi:hypothetical protein
MQLDKQLRNITTGASVSFEDQQIMISTVVAESVEKYDGSFMENVGITPESCIGIALHDVTQTAYFSEAQFRVLEVGSAFRYLATTGVANCLSVFVSSPTGPSFGVHLNLVCMHYSLKEANVHGGGVFQNMVDALRKAFIGTDHSEIKISFVGGWINADLGTKMKQIYQRKQEQMWSFSGVIVDCFKDTFPGAAIDTSKMNRLHGVSWEKRTQKSKLKSIIAGDAYRFVVLDTHTGVVHVQRTNIGDFCLGKGSGVMFPNNVLISSLTDLTDMHSRVAKFNDTVNSMDGHESILKQNRGDVDNPIVSQEINTDSRRWLKDIPEVFE